VTPTTSPRPTGLREEGDNGGVSFHTNTLGPSVVQGTSLGVAQLHSPPDRSGSVGSTWSPTHSQYNWEWEQLRGHPLRVMPIPTMTLATCTSTTIATGPLNTRWGNNGWRQDGARANRLSSVWG
jgi:hypothetical protein